MEVVEIQEDKEWKIYLEGQDPIRLIVDRRMKPISRWGKLFKGGGITSYNRREIRIAPGVSQTTVGHEVGHVMLEHGRGEEEGQLGPDFIREELEAEYWAYNIGFPKRRNKIEDLRELAIGIGMTSSEFDRMHLAVRKGFK